jgi:hypothetical protein
MKQELLENIISDDDIGLLRCKYTTNLKRFRSLISSQDLIRRVMCTESGNTYNELKKLDKSLSKAINNFSIKYSIGSVTNQNFEE